MQRAGKVLFIGCLALHLSASVPLAADQSTNSPASATNQTAKADTFVQPKTLAELLALPPDQLEKVDIARIDLLCAEGLPGADDLDVEKCVQTLDEWANRVKAETDKNYHRFVEHPEKFRNDFGRYRMAVLAAVLAEDFRVQYNPQREKELLDNRFFADAGPYGKAERSFFSDSSDLFLHGTVSPKRYGTCASLPYLYVAVGRRLGYPVSIAQTHMHNYVYYDEGDGKHFNVEATENRFFTTPTDDAYRHPIWGAPSSQEYFEKRGLLRPLSNKEAMAHLLGTRAAVFRSAGRHDEEAKTWATAARYFPDTPTWKEISENMQQCAKMDDYQKWRDGIWKELASYYIPHGPGFAYFHDKKIKLHLFMNESFDRKAVEQAANEYKKELSDYTGMVMPIADSGKVALTITNQPPPETQQVYFFYRPPDGNEVRVPADFMPPFPHRELPMELKVLICDVTKPQDPDALLEVMWQYYEHTQAMERDRQKAEVERIASGNPILISEESIPPEFRNGVPMDLGIQLSGLHSAQDIVIAMWQYKQQQQAQRQLQAMTTDPMGQVASMLRQAGVPDSVARMSGLPGAGAQGPTDPLTAALRQGGVPDSVARMAGLPMTGSQGAGLPGMGGAPGMNPFDPTSGLAAQGLIPGVNRRGLTAIDAWTERTKQANEQAMDIIAQQMRPADGMKPGFALPFQVVPASVAAKNPTVQNPMPFGGSHNSPLTASPQRTITTSTNRSDVP